MNSIKKTKNVQQNTKAKTSPRKKWTIIVVSVVIGYIVSLFLPFISPYTKYPLYLIKCGQEPIIGNRFAGTNSYALPGDKIAYNINWFNTEYYCTQDEAKAAGLQRYNYY